MKIFKAYLLYLLPKLSWLVRFELGRELNLCRESSVSLVALLEWVPIVAGSQCQADNSLMRLLLASSDQPSKNTHQHP